MAETPAAHEFLVAFRRWRAAVSSIHGIPNHLGSAPLDPKFRKDITEQHDHVVTALAKLELAAARDTVTAARDLYDQMRQVVADDLRCGRNPLKLTGQDRLERVAELDETGFINAVRSELELEPVDAEQLDYAERDDW